MARYPRTPAPALSRISPPLARVLNALSVRWGLLVLEELAGGHVRFNELQRHLVGISHKVLIETLRVLQRDGFVRKLVWLDDATNQSVAEYRLTELGSALLDWVDDVKRWAEQPDRTVTADRYR